MTDTEKKSPFRLLGTAAVALALGTLREERGASRSVERKGSRAEAPVARDADGPGDVSASGWTAVLKRTFKEIGNDHVMLVAAGVTFYALLALFPALAALVSVYGLFADPAAIRDHLAALEGTVPEGALTVISDQVETLAARGSTALGLSFILGLGVSLWSANSGVKAVFEALNIAYEENEERSFVRLTLVSLAFTLSGLVFVLLALATLIALPVLTRTMALGGILETLLLWLRWPILLVVVALLIAILYRYGPSRQPPEWRWVSWGGAIAAALWVMLSVAFSWYASNFGSYNATYGSLGAVIGFMTWIWLSVIVIVTGAELNSELEHQTARDTTTGPDREMGRRGAVMADRVAGGPDRARDRSDDL